MSVHNPSLTEILDELVSQGFVNRINFAGAGVAVAVAGGLATVTIPGGGGGGASATTIEQNLGATADWRGSFTITDAAIAATSKVLVWQAPGPYTGKGTAASADEGTMDPIMVTAVVPATGSCVVHWQTAPIVTPVPFGQTGGNGGNPDTTSKIAGHRSEHDITMVRRIGKVRGNVKFSYVVFA